MGPVTEEERRLALREYAAGQEAAPRAGAEITEEEEAEAHVAGIRAVMLATCWTYEQAEGVILNG